MKRAEEWGAAQLNQPHKPSDTIIRKRSATKCNEEGPVPKRQRGITSEFRGISWSTTQRRWRASAGIDGKQQHHGHFDDEHEAAQAVDTAARRL
jgi:hypothetical protein